MTQYTSARFFSHLTRTRTLAIATMLAACGLERIDEGGDGDTHVPDAVQDVFDRECTSGGCHENSGPAEGLSLEAGDSDSIIGGPSRQSDLPMVEIGSVEDSYMAIKLLPKELLPDGVERDGAQMPLGAIEEPDAIAVILGWIAGAPISDGRDVENSRRGGDQAGRGEEDLRPGLGLSIR